MDTKINLNKPEIVIFDWDDTLIETWEHAFAALNTALVHMGLEAWSEDEVRRRSGPSGRDLFKELFQERWEEADKVYYDAFMKSALDKIQLFSDAEELLEKLDKGNIPMALVSNKRAALLHEEVEKSGLRPYFKAVIGAGEAEADKPHPAPILLALSRMEIAPSKAVWYIGDSHTDMMSANDAGCTSILIETKCPPEDLLIGSPPVGRFKTLLNIMEFVCD